MAARKPRSKKKVAWHQNIDWRRWGWLAAKLALVGFAFLLVTGIYLDSLIREKFDGQKWQLPALVYSRPLELYPGQRLSMQQMLHELKLLNYRQSKQPQGAGQYAAGGNKLVLIRRPFKFADGNEGARPLLLTFNG